MDGWAAVGLPYGSRLLDGDGVELGVALALILAAGEVPQVVMADGTMVSLADGRQIG